MKAYNKIIFSAVFQKKLKTIGKKDLKLFQKIKKQLKLFKNNKKHPSLRLHKLQGNLKNVWSISVDMSIRLLFIDENDTAYFFDLGTHDEVYGK